MTMQFQSSKITVKYLCAALASLFIVFTGKATHSFIATLSNNFWKM